MSAACRSLIRFIRAKDNEQEHGEIRDYAIQYADDLAEAFGVTVSVFLSGIASEADDARLARRLYAEAKRAGRENRAARSAERACSAQAAADALGALAVWEDDRASIEISTLR